MTAILVIAAAVSAAGQSSSPVPVEPQEQTQLPPSASVTTEAQSSPETSPAKPTFQQLLDFKDSDVKFDLRDLMDTLRDRRHEGWVLAAYPDPKTSRPLIGAGFTLDLPAREHPQRDPLNAHPFIEPSSDELWQAAGLDSERLQTILDQYEKHLAMWKKKKFQKKIATLTPEINEDEATLLLRISAIQAIYNAKAYCRNFDQYTASQQMALSQLVYQMGVNLQEFGQFLNLINSDSSALPQLSDNSDADAEYWKAVQSSLIQSQWARLYRVRAASVIAMLDPQYSDGPAVAEHRVTAVLRPAVVHRHRDRSAGSLRNASLSGHSGGGHPGKSIRKKKSRVRSN
jgi:hypothetical protein